MAEQETGSPEDAKQLEAKHLWLHLGLRIGEGGIRTRGTVSRTRDFQSRSLSHSDTSPPALSRRHRGRYYSRTARKGNAVGTGAPECAAPIVAAGQDTQVASCNPE